MQSTIERMEWSKHCREQLYTVNLDALHNNTQVSFFYNILGTRASSVLNRTYKFYLYNIAV